GALTLATRRRLSGAAFLHTAEYDTAIATYFAGGSDLDSPEASGDDLPASLDVSLPLAQALRYGENPHQKAGFYSDGAPYEVLHGKALSTNNLLDLTAALDLIGEFDNARPTVAILKHTNPCGVGQGETPEAAYRRAFATDTASPFGGIVVLNRPLDQATAEAINAVFTEIIIAPDYEDGVLGFLQKKKNRRLLTYAPQASGENRLLLRSVAGGILAQEADAALGTAAALRERCSVATKRAPTDDEWAALDFAWRICKHVKSNAIVYGSGDAASGGWTLGIGAGQMSRIDASEVAVRKAEKEDLDLTGSVVASDAFFPFPDGLMAAADAGARAAIQPGGSVRDAEVIEAADARGLAMVFTGQRHFRH
ncbi:MAG: bifunctional phosphoribosylaminoimidazolecarboxamide formyltransferase/IMP cyclohydrolase, partial [Bacteroidota bacterium]